MTLIHVVAVVLTLTASADAQILDSTNGTPHGSITINQCDVATPIIVGVPVFYEHMIERPVKAFLLDSMRRDFAGRTRTERPIINIRPGLPSADPPVLVEIHDPSVNFCYALEQSRHIAHRMRIAPNDHLVALTQAIPRYLTFDGSTRIAESGSSSALLSQQDLGKQLINDEQAEGQRTRQRFSNGAIVMTETWTSRELNRVILVKRLDGPSNESTMLIDLNRHGPDPSFFAIPKDYTIIDETGPFSIQF